MTLLLFAELLFLGALLFCVIPFGMAFFRGAPFAPSGREAVEVMVCLSGVRKGERAADLGSGDGRLVVALARAGAEAHGYEINPLLVWWSRRKIRTAGLEQRAFIHKKNFWKEDLSRYAVLTIFGIGYIMENIEAKLKKELRLGARVVCNGAPLLGWRRERKEGGVSLYVKDS